MSILFNDYLRKESLVRKNQAVTPATCFNLQHFKVYLPCGTSNGTSSPCKTKVESEAGGLNPLGACVIYQ
jgi:hypothetical protein